MGKNAMREAVGFPRWNFWRPRIRFRSTSVHMAGKLNSGVQAK